MAPGAAIRDYHRENLEGEQRWRDGRRERRKGEGQIIVLIAIGESRVEGRGGGEADPWSYFCFVVLS